MIAQLKTWKYPTIGDFDQAVLRVDVFDEFAVKKFFDDYVEEIIERDTCTYGEAELLAKKNIGRVFGEGMDEASRKLWNAIVGAAHPFWGVMPPDNQTVAEMGKRAGELEKDKMPPAVIEDFVRKEFGIADPFGS